MARSQAMRHPIASLIICFILWKTLLMAVVWISPGLGYDTSSNLLLVGDGTGPEAGGSATALITRLMRWDAIYFAKVAERGYIYEQEWAWGWGFTRLLSFVAKASTSSPATVEAHIWAGVVISHVSHLASVFVLYFLVQKLRLGNVDDRTAFAAAALHIVSQGGAFLSAPYTESLFSFLSFSGTYLLLDGTQPTRTFRSLSQDLSVLTAGVVLGLATTVRSNGIFNGLMIAYDFAQGLVELSKNIKSFTLWRQIVSLGVAGIFLGAGFLGPQAIAFFDYCEKNPQGDYPRPWCDSSFLPSIYTWVQKYYWGTGFLKYWTLSNLPLFALSSPVLVIFFASALETLNPVIKAADHQHRQLSTYENKDATTKSSDPKAGSKEGSSPYTANMLQLALPQLVVAILALTYFHVQIINRISSGYPLWYIWIARQLVDRPLGRVRAPKRKNSAAKRFPRAQPQAIVRGMVVYAVIQAGLFSSFLPPA